MQKLPISVFIIAKNEADRISKPILSVRDWVDEIIVIDSGSSDNTVKIAEDLGCKTEFRKWEGFGPQKVYGESLCKNKWVLNIDADEEISSKLQKEIIDIFKDGKPDADGYKMLFVTMGRFAKKPPIIGYTYYYIRLYNKDMAGFKASKVHDSVEMKESEKVKKLKGSVWHRSLRSHTHAIEKINSYSSMQAHDMLEKKRKPSSFRIIIEPIFAFFKAYILRRYCFLGMEGFIESYIYAFSRFIRLAKTRELWIEIDS